uniref:Isopenicillin N synthase-like Fe(2+) 2OG dioxygenase domain-containing protein n=1 Tax=Brassica oleracea TaxID=3712 RepID=A0A3P6GKW2_BRAOL|nr:unnamed protein product [Brassica oleracea]
MVSLETTPALQLPVIDFTSPNLKPGTVEWDSVRGDVRRALEDEAVMSFAKKVSELDFMTRRMIMECFGVNENYIEKHLNSTKCLNDVKDGLEVRTSDDKQWIKANPSQDSSFIVLGGATLHVLLNGRVLTGVHRVMRMGTNTRFSAGLFSVPKTEDLIYAPEELVDAEHPRLYKPFDFEAYFQFTTEGPGRRDVAALGGYCGL